METRPEIKRRLLTFVVVGGGYSGVEIAGHILDLFHSIHEYYPLPSHTMRTRECKCLAMKPSIVVWRI